MAEVAFAGFRIIQGQRGQALAEEVADTESDNNIRNPTPLHSLDHRSSNLLHLYRSIFINVSSFCTTTFSTVASVGFFSILKL